MTIGERDKVEEGGRIDMGRDRDKDRNGGGDKWARV